MQLDAIPSSLATSLPHSNRIRDFRRRNVSLQTARLTTRLLELLDISVSADLVCGMYNNGWEYWDWHVSYGGAEIRDFEHNGAVLGNTGLCSGTLTGVKVEHGQARHQDLLSLMMNFKIGRTWLLQWNMVTVSRRGLLVSLMLLKKGFYAELK